MYINIYIVYLTMRIDSPMAITDNFTPGVSVGAFWELFSQRHHAAGSRLRGDRHWQGLGRAWGAIGSVVGKKTKLQSVDHVCNSFYMF